MTVNGSLMGYADYDPGYNGSLEGVDNLRIAYVHSGAQEFSVYEHGGIKIDDKSYSDFLYTQAVSDPRWSFQGSFWLIAASGIPASTEYGMLMLHYEIEFAVPSIPAHAPTSSFVTTATFTAKTCTAGQYVFWLVDNTNPTWTTLPDQAYSVSTDIDPVAYVGVLIAKTGTWPTIKTNHQETIDYVSSFAVGQVWYWTPDINANGYCISPTIAAAWNVDLISSWATSVTVTGTMTWLLTPLDVV
jgi:hypothetical protein